MQRFVGTYILFCGVSIIILAFLYDRVYNRSGNEFHSNTAKDIPRNNFRLATKTPYRAVQNDVAEEISFPGCSPNKLWALLRHGTRTSKKKHKAAVCKLNSIRDAIIQQLMNAAKKGIVNEQLLEEIKNWNSHEDFNDGHQTLTNEGEDEMFNLGRRYFARFRSIFDDSYANKTYIMRYTNTQRTNKSAYYFASGIFNEPEDDEYNMEVVSSNELIRFYKDCQRWRTEVKKNFSANMEQVLFDNSTLMKDLIANVSRKLGFEEGLSLEMMHIMYMTCCYETAWRLYYDLSPWCKVFSDPEMQIMEYREDIRYYWLDGYGHSLNRQLPCILFKNAIGYLTSEKGDYKSTFYFSHSGTLLKFLAYLNLYEDSHQLKHNNFHQMKHRKWRTSVIDPFGTNIAFISYVCGGERYILTMHQERPVILPGCPTDHYLCPSSTIFDLYKDSLLKCDVMKICSN